MAQERTRSLARWRWTGSGRTAASSCSRALRWPCSWCVCLRSIVVVGGGALIGRTGSPSVWLSVLATAIVAIAFEPVRTRMQTSAGSPGARTRIGRRRTRCWRSFPSTVTGSYPAEELPAPDGQGAGRGHRRRTGRSVAGRPRTAGTGRGLAAQNRRRHGPASDHPPVGSAWPPPIAAAPTDARSGASGPAPVIVVEGLRHSLAVRERGELLGALTVVVRDGQRVDAGRGAAVRRAGRAVGPDAAGRRPARRARAAARPRWSAARGELRRARRDLVTRQDAERQRLERNIHDGAQQEVLALLVNLRLTQTLFARAPERGARLLAEQAAAARRPSTP